MIMLRKMTMNRYRLQGLDGCFNVGINMDGIFTKFLLDKIVVELYKRPVH